MNTPMQIFLNAAFINNFVLALFLGICPFLGVSAKTDTAIRMGGAVSFVMLVSSVCAYGIHQVLVLINAPYLQLIAYIVVIASSVQLVEMIIKKFSPVLFQALGIFLPLITTNCAILGVALFQTNREYDFVQSLSFALGAGFGFTVALVLMSGLRERLDLSSVSSLVQGAALTLFLAGILSMAFMGFAGDGQLNLWYHLLIALAGLSGLILAWTMIQSLARKQLPPDAPERDVLACSSCAASGVCACGLKKPTALDE